MRLDLVVPNEGPFANQAVQGAPLFEDLGYDGLWFTDHIIGLDAYAPVYGPYWLEMLTVMAHVAARTKRVRLGAGVLVAPYRDPVTAAKILATLDVLSGGRVDLGIGAGWARREFAAVGRGEVFEDRGPFTNEVLDVMLQCWKGGRVAFEGRWFKFEKIDFQPVPAQGERVPLWIGGRGLGAAPLRRAARYADVWHPTGLSAEDLRSGGERLDEMAGRKVPRSVRLRGDGDPGEVTERLAAYRDAGCMQVALALDEPQTFAEFARAAEALYARAKVLQTAAGG